MVQRWRWPMTCLAGLLALGLVGGQGRWPVARAQTPDGATLYLPWAGRHHRSEPSLRVLRPPTIRGLAYAPGEDALWAATPNGALRWEADADLARYSTFTRADGLVAEDLSGVMVDTAGRVWVAGVGGIFAPRGRRALDELGRGGGPAEEAGSNTVEVLALAEGPAGRMLAGTKAGLVELGPDGRWAPLAGGPSSGWVRGIAVDAARGEIALATGLDGQRRLADGSWLHYEVGNSGADAVHFDAAGNLWIGGRTLSVWWRIDGRREDFALPTFIVWALAQDDSGALWCGTDAGLSRRDSDGSWQHLLPSGGDHAMRVTALTTKGTTLWAGRTDGNLSRGEAGGDWTTHRVDGIPLGADVLSLGGAGEAWIGGDAGLARLAPDGGWRWYGQQAGLRGTSVASIVLDSAGRAWVGTEGNDGGPPFAGLFSIEPDGRLIDRSPPDLNDRTPTLGLLTPDGSVWHLLGCTQLLVDRPDGRRERIDPPAPMCADAAAVDGADGTIWWQGGGDALVGLGPQGDWRTLPTDGRIGDLLDLDAAFDGGLWLLGARGLLQRDASGAERMWTANALGFEVSSRGELLGAELGVGRAGTLAVAHRRGLGLRESDGSWLHLSQAELTAIDPAFAVNPSPLANVHDLELAADGSVWIAAGNQVARLAR